MESKRKLSAFGVMGRSLLILLRNLPVFVFLGLLLFTPVFVGSLIVGPGAPIHAQRVDVDDVEAVRHTELGGKVVVGILAFLATYLVAGGVSYGVRQNLQGRRVPVVEGVREGLRRLVGAASTRRSSRASSSVSVRAARRAGLSGSRARRSSPCRPALQEDRAVRGVPAPQSAI